MIEYRAWCVNGDLIKSVELPDDASAAARQAAREACDAAIDAEIADARSRGLDPKPEDYSVQYCEGDRDMTGHDYQTTGRY